MTEPENKDSPRRTPVNAIDAPDGFQVKRIIDACKRKGMRKHEILIKFAWMTALRLNALTNIKVGYINFMKQEVKVPAELQKNTKNIKKQDENIVLNELPYINDLEDYIKERNLQPEDYLFNHGDPRKRYSPRMIAYMIREAGDLIGFDRLRPHLLRHSRAKYLLKEGYTVKFVQSLLLHEDAATTLNQYSRFSLKELHDEGMAGAKLSDNK